MARKFKATISTTRTAPTAPARSNAGGATRGKARAAQVKAMNAAKKKA